MYAKSPSEPEAPQCGCLLFFICALTLYFCSYLAGYLSGLRQTSIEYSARAAAQESIKIVPLKTTDLSYATYFQDAWNLGKSMKNTDSPCSSGSDKTLWKGKTVLLDAGHGGHDPGAVRMGIREKDITLKIVLQLKTVLESRGAKVLLTRSDDKVDLELADIARIIDTAKPSVFISIHVNCSPKNQDTSGIQTYFREKCSRMLAHTMHTVLIQDLKASDKGIFTSHFWVLNNPNIPSLLIETGFITNRPDRRKLISASYQRKFCLAIADGLEHYWAKKHLGKTQ